MLQEESPWKQYANKATKANSSSSFMATCLYHIVLRARDSVEPRLLTKVGIYACRGNECHSHNTSLAILRTHRKLGLATKLMIAAQAAMEHVFGAEYVLLHVRKSNRVTFNLYTQTLGYKIHDVEAKYYANGEDAYDIRKQLKGKSSHHHIHQNHHHHHHNGGGFCSGDARSAETANTRGDSKSESKARTESGSKAG
ncbi:N-terminal acetyltransferase A complex catalytic subunit NAA10-like [Hibiscus syriacus]|uniref:N-terminal acetyltransferase A complex catalytic subunit NAA10-like n=1 Tax=Hibiscus syriacus TaxID=106335 RepID=UPI001923F1F9|nr:N-terminal acetyltransferase A complex catalytic subunit NAA10-like [Hibiscus syriacus]